MADVTTSRDGAVSTQNHPRSTVIKGGGVDPQKNPRSLSDEYYREEFIGAIEEAAVHGEVYAECFDEFKENGLTLLIFPTPKTSPRAKPFDYWLMEGEP